MSNLKRYLLFTYSAQPAGGWGDYKDHSDCLGCLKKEAKRLTDGGGPTAGEGDRSGRGIVGVSLWAHVVDTQTQRVVYHVLNGRGEERGIHV